MAMATAPAVPSAQPTAAAAAAKNAGRPAKNTNSKKLRMKDLPPPPTNISCPSGVLTRGKQLGEGGFARVYLVKSSQGRKAIKAVAKQQLKSSQQRVKLFSEIKLHRSLSHPNIIQFHEVFEDPHNVYMLVELCHNGSMFEQLRTRKRYTEPEARFYMVQMVCAVEYMHAHSIIHRDLKLGNLMLDANMNIKIGDFGLAALVAFPGERKKTLCGTPNYIAPEILFDRAHGHSFEADIWSIGVILYTLIVGKPPFQTQEVDALYEKIKHCEYAFPSNLQISYEACDLITSILTTDPKKRPTLREILAHPFVNSSPFPDVIPSTALTEEPDFSHIAQRASSINLRKAIVEASDWEPPEVPEETPTDQVNLIRAERDRHRVEKEVKHALEPASPIADLLRSARKPLMVSPRDSEAGQNKENHGYGTRNRLRKLELDNTEAAKKRAAAAVSASKPLSEMQQNIISKPKSAQAKETKTNPTTILTSANMNTNHGAGAGPATSASATTTNTIATSVPANNKATANSKPDDTAAAPSREVFETFINTIETALNSQVDESPQDNASSFTPPKVFITSWIDYTHKYGTAYQLTDGTTGVYFNDNTTLALAPIQTHLDFVSNKRGQHASRKNYPVDNAPEDLSRKIYLLHHFQKYMRSTLERDVDWTFVDSNRSSDMDYLVRYYRAKNAIVFRLSNGVLQFNFFDQHVKIILSSHGTMVSLIGPDYKLQTWSLRYIMEQCRILGIDPLQTTDEELGSKHKQTINLVASRISICVDILKTLSKPTDNKKR